MSRPKRRAPRGSGEQLRAEIVAATKELLAAAPDSASVSIRAVAQAVGVTSPSIYLHFADKDALIEAVCVDVFTELDAAMIAAGRDVTDPLDRLIAYGVAYVEFAVDHPQHYRVATMEPPRSQVVGFGGELDHMLADSAFSHLLATVTECVETGRISGGEPLVLAMELWTAAHGIASLMITKPFLPWGDRRAFAEHALCGAAMGRVPRPAP
ncbi:MAG: TetR/AcrR family transcriptional regulator [Actinobacteria bacterium]|nr:TetR/AcrR family transcriptional regulator [Actinomycetota bacterium]